MAKTRESSTDKGMLDIGSEFGGGGMEKKPNWVNLAQLDGPMDESIANRLLYKPALRFHGITGGIWGQGLSDAHSVMSDPPPSYRFAESTTSRQPGNDACSTCDVDTLYNTVNISAQSPLTLRRRNTVAVILVAIGLLAAVAAVTGVILHFLHPKAMLRANVRFTIANRNYTDDMKNKTAIDFHTIARPLCQEMDVYFLTSELADFYLGCNVVSMRKDSTRAYNGTDVHFTLDFIENKVSNDAERIKKVILRKSGRHKTEDALYLTVRDFLVYLRSLRVSVEVLSLPDDHPGRKHRPRIPWDEDIDFIARLPKSPDFSDIEDMKEILRQLVNNMYNMTAKIDHMQDAINYINKTFHETHRPLFNLEETLGNMTTSLDNLNQNLNSINATMNAFKEFLKQFGDTVFNIDDVIKYIDETVGNLGNAVTYIENAMTDLNGTVNGIAENVVDLDKTLTYVNRSVLDVNNTAAYSNQTLDSMKNTLDSLENALSGLALKVHIVTDDADLLHVSLKNINDTVKNTHGKLNRLHSKTQKLNSSMTRVEKQVYRLNDTYIKINKTLLNMNEPYMFINGTVLEVIQKLSSMDEQLYGLHTIMDTVKTNISSMNVSLLDSMNWMKEMVQTLTKFNMWVGSSNNTIKVSLSNKGMIETVGMLLNMNLTLSDIGHKVDDINFRLDKVDEKLQYLEEQLSMLDRTLDNIDVKFKLLDKTLLTINSTVKDTKSSINVINSTVKAMDSTFKKIDVSFGNINDTLDSVNKTLILINSTGKEIDLTVINVTRAFTRLANNIDNTAQAAQYLKNTVSTLNGSVSELNAQLAGAKEALSYTIRKADTAAESYRRLNKTLFEANKTLSDLEEKLIDTNNTLQHTNISLTHVNDSLLGIQDSFKSLRMELSDVQNSFIQMKSSMEGFGSAFPNIQNSILESQRRMSELQIQIMEIDDELNVHKIQRDGLIKKHVDLNEDMKLISDMIRLVKLSIDQLITRSSHLQNDINFLTDSVHEASHIYNKTERNILFINETHEKVKEKYQNTQQKANKTALDLEAVKKEMNSAENRFEALKPILNNYSNIDVNFDSLLNNIANQTERYETAERKFQNWTKRFNGLDGIIWDINGNPSKVFHSFNELVNRTELVNKTADDYIHVLNETSTMILSMNNFSEYLHKKNNVIGGIRDKIDVIERTEADLNTDIAKTNDRINERQHSLNERLKTLNETLSKFKRVRDTYGDVSSKYNSVDFLDDLENQIKLAIRQIQENIASLNDSRSEFGTAVDKYKFTNNTYQNKVFDLGVDSLHTLDNTLFVMEQTKVKINNMSSQLDAIKTSLKDIDNRISDIANEIDTLENTLSYQKQKDTFVTDHRFKLESRFNMSFEKISEPFSVQQVLFKLLREVENKSKMIDERNNEIANMNITILEEKTAIDHLNTSLKKNDEELLKARHYLETFYKRFAKYDESNETLTEVQKQYDKFSHAVEHFTDAVKNISSLQTGMIFTASNISDTFDYLISQITEFQRFATPIVQANVTSQLVQSKFLNTSTNVKDAAKDFLWIKGEFENIKRQYNNFTATEVDLTESYVVEAINELDEHFQNLTFELQLANLRVESIQTLLNETETAYSKAIYNRTNIESNLKNIIHPNLNNISKANEKVSSELDNLNSIIQTIEFSIKGVNETIHIQNKQLFIDRQKQLLADTKFPNLETSTKFANNSLSESLNDLQKARLNLEKTMDDFRSLQKRVETHASVNISFEEFENNLRNHNDRLEKIYENLIENFAMLNKANATIWTQDDTRYSSNETVSSMKARYKYAEELLSSILTNVTDINSSIESISNETKEINMDLSSVNMSINDFNKANSMLQDLYQELSPICNDANEISIKTKGLSYNFRNITEMFNLVKERYSNINESFYNFYVLPFSDEKLLVGQDIDSLSNATEIVIDNCNEAYALEGTINETYDTKKALEDIIKHKNNISRKIIKTIDLLGNNLRAIRQNVSVVVPELQKLDDGLNEMKQLFSLQEKQQYFARYFPGKAYDSLKDTVIDVIKQNDGLRSNLTTVKQSFKHFKRDLDRQAYINFNTSATENLIISTTLIVDNNTESLKNILEDCIELEQMLYAADGSVISDNETIDEMKVRYERIEKHMDVMNAELETIRNEIRRKETALEQTSDTIAEFQFLLELYNKISEGVYELIENNKKLNRTVKEIKSMNKEREGEFRYETKRYRNLIFAFPGTTSDHIQELKKNINDSIYSLEGNIGQLNKSGLNLYDEFSISEDLIANYSDELFSLHVETVPLKHILNDFPWINDSVNSMSQVTSNKSKSLQLKGKGIDRDMAELKNNIELLKQLLNQQEKHDYIKRNAPDLLYLLNKAKNETNQTKIEIENLTESRYALKELGQIVKNVTENELSVDISLLSTRNMIALLDVNISNLRDIINEGFSNLSSIDEQIFDESGIYFYPNDTIDDIKNTFEILNRTIKNVVKQLSFVLNEKDAMLKDIGKENTFLQNLKEETQKLTKLKTVHVTSKQVIYKNGKNLNETKVKSNHFINKLEILEDRLGDIVQKYGDVKEPSLHQDINLFYDEFKHLKDKYKSVTSLINDTSKTYNDTREESENVDNILAEVSKNLEELKTKTDITRPIIEQLANETYALKTNISNISKATQEYLITIPKTEKNIADLEEKLRRQQIFEYIKENFPTLLDEYANVNKTLNGLDMRIPDVSTYLQFLSSNNSDLMKNINALGLLKIPVDEKLKAYTLLNGTFSDVFTEKQSLVIVFNEFQDVISNNFESNETLNDIKKRFAVYETNLLDMNQKLRTLNKILDKIEPEIRKELQSTQLHREVVYSYKNVLQSEQEKEQELNRLTDLMNNTLNDVEVIQTTAESQKTRLAVIGARFKNVSHPALHDEKLLIEQDLKNAIETVAKTRGNLKKEMKMFDKSVNDHRNLRLQLNQNILSFNQLQKITENASSILDAMSLNVKKLKLDSEKKIRPRISTDNATIMAIETAIDNLESKFLKRETQDYIQSNLPLFIAQYSDLNQSLSETKKRVSEMERQRTHAKQTIVQLQDRINKLANIKIKMVNATVQNRMLKDNILEVNEQLHITTKYFVDLDVSLFEKKDWSNFSIEEVKEMFTIFKNNVSLINATLNSTNSVIDTIGFKLMESVNELNHTDSVLNRYENSVGVSVGNEKRLEELSFKLGETNTLLEDVKKRFYYDGDRLFNLTKKYSQVTNADIENIIEETRSILEGTVGLRIPLANKLFSNRLMENYNVVRDRFDDVVYTLNKNYTTKDQLENILGYVDDTLNNVTLETEYMAGNEQFYREDAIRLSDLLNESNTLLNRLEEMYKAQKKIDMLHHNIPILQKQWKLQSERLQNITDDLKVTSSKMINLKSIANKISNTLDKIETVTIPVNDIHNRLMHASLMLNKTTTNSGNAKLKLDDISLFDIDVNSLANNKTISVGDVQQQLDLLQNSLQEADKSIKKTDTVYQAIKNNVTSTSDSIMLLNETLSKFIFVEGKVNDLTEKINNTSTRIIDTSHKLRNADAKIANYKNTLKDLREKYKQYQYDSSDVELLLNVTDDKLLSLNDTLSESSVLLLNASTENKNFSAILYTITDDIQALNKSVNTIILATPKIVSKVDGVNNILDSIRNSIPDLNIEMQDIKDMLRQMNETLISEDLKSNFAENALPLLEEKYRITNMTFEMTNKTLQRMANELSMLIEYTETLKQRMKDFSTINISVSDIDANITYLENRIVIMQDHYDNVKGIVNTFQTDVRVNNIFGRNISLSDVEDQYKSFNNTLDLINGVLSKIDDEAYEMEEHFGVLNDTMHMIDSALDRFEKKQMNTKIMEKEIELIGNDIADTNDSISKIIKTVNRFSLTFKDMGVMYADVIDSTAENNTIINDLLTSMNQSLVNLQDLMSELNKMHTQNTDEFGAMNETLFKTITSYADLNNTLGYVKNKLLRLSKSINKLQRDIVDAKQQTTGKNSTLSELSELLVSLNDTLYREQIKHDFIQNNFGNLQGKLTGLKSPVEKTNKTLSKINEKLSNASDFVIGVARKLKDFSNVNISLSNDILGLTNMRKDVDNITKKLQYVGDKYNKLQNNITELNDRSGEIKNIVGKYTVINQTLDEMQDNLTEMLGALNDINFDSDLILNKTEKLESSLDKLDRLNTSVLSLENDMDLLADELNNTSAKLSESKSNTNDLKKSLENMKRLYSPLEDQSLLDSLLQLMNKVNETSEKLYNIQSMHNATIMKNTDTVRALQNTKTRLNSKIDQQIILDDINTASESAIKNIQNKTDATVNVHNTTANEINTLQNTIEVLTYEILRLNETLAEEKKKKDFIADNFPDMEQRYNLLNSLLEGSNRNIDNTSKQVNTVASDLSKVKDRLDNITAIAIPLDLENSEVLRIRNVVEKVRNDLVNISNVYNDIQIQKLKNMSTGFDNLVDTYGRFDNSMQTVEKTIRKMNNAVDDLNKTISVIKESVQDINSTVDEYIEIGEKIADVLETRDRFSSKLKNTNETIANLSREVQKLGDSLQSLLANYSHITDPEILKAQDLIKHLLKSSKENIRSIENRMSVLGTDNESSLDMIERMNETYVSTKQLIGELKRHINEVKNVSNVVNGSLDNMDTKQRAINDSATVITPELKDVFDRISQLTETYAKEQKKIDLIASNKPSMMARFKNLQQPLEKTNQHISLTEVKLADLKYAVKTVGARLDKFKTLNITTDPELQKWNNMSQTVENMSRMFQQISQKYEHLHASIDTIEDRNITYDDMKHKFSDINTTLDDIESELKHMDRTLTEVENEITDTENALNNLQTSMNNVKVLQNDVAKTRQNIGAMHSTVAHLGDRTKSIVDTNTKIKDQLDTMKTMYAALNNREWNELLPKVDNDLTKREKKLHELNRTKLNQEQKLNSTSYQFDNLSEEISTNPLSRQEVDPTISSYKKRLVSIGRKLKELEKPLTTKEQTLTALQAATNKTQKQVNMINRTLHDELLKYNYVKQNLPTLKEKHSNVNTTFVKNVPSMDSLKGQVTNLVSIIQRIKDKMHQYGVMDTDNSLKRWDLAIEKLNATVATILKKNDAADKKLVELKSILWSNNTMYSKKESLSDVITRFELYNKTLDEINAASHTINIKLADLDSAASRVIGQLMERDAVLTTTPATTTPSGPPEWLSFQSTVSGEIGKDPGIAECSVQDLNEWQMMKITRVNKDGKEEPIAAWKLGLGARKAVRDRRIRVKREKTATGGKLTVGIQALQCEDEGTYYCSIDSYNMWPLKSSIAVVSPPEDNLKPDFPTEVFEDKVANFSCTGHPGYPNGRLTWKIKREKDKDFRPFDFYSSKSMVADTSCVRTETNKVEYQFDLQWNNTKVRCYIENTDFYAEGIIRLLPFDICNKVRYLGTISHPYTPHKYIVCGKELNIMQCPGNTCYDEKEENCVRCKAGHGGGGDPCHGQPLFSYVAHETDCKKYYICMGPTKTSKKCTKGYFAPNIPGNCVMSYAQSHCGRKTG